MISSAPKFKKVELLLKSDENKSKYGITSSHKISYDDCAMIITGDYIIITIETGSNIINEPTSITGKIYKLEEVVSYRLFNN